MLLDLESLGNIGDFIGGLAVIASLIYLGLQIRQNTNLVRNSISTAFLEANIEHNRLLVQDPEVARIYWAGVEDRENLSLEDRRRFDPLINIVFRTYQHAYSMGPEAFGGGKQNMSVGMTYMLSQPGIKSFWRDYEKTYAPDFRQFVVELMAGAGNAASEQSDSAEPSSESVPDQSGLPSAS